MGTVSHTRVMRTALAFGVVLSSLLLIGCGGGNSPVGKWTGKMEMPKGSPNAEMAQGLMGAMSLDLEIKEDKKFTMTVMGFNIDGSYKQDGKNLTLTPEKSMGQPIPANQSNSQPLKVTMSDDGKTLSVIAEGKNPGMTFTRSEKK